VVQYSKMLQVQVRAMQYFSFHQNHSGNGRHDTKYQVPSVIQGSSVYTFLYGTYPFNRSRCRTEK